MKISFTKLPVDLFLCLIWSVSIFPIVIYSLNNTVRMILGLPFLIFIPGYVLVGALFPMKKKGMKIDTFERIALSFGLSVALVPFFGFILNFTPWGITLQSILISVFFFIALTCVIAVYRWYKISGEERFIFSLESSPFKTKSTLEKVLIVFLGLSILLTFSAFLYVAQNPLIGESFTEFYVLGPEGKIAKYPLNLSIGDNGTVIIGVANHEYTPLNYTVEIWLINETTSFNETSQKNETTYTHMWFMNKVSQTITNIPFTNDKGWSPQWEYKYTFQIKRRGGYKLTFLLFTTPTQNYNQYEDYKTLAQEKIEYAYERTFLQIHVV